MIVEAILCVMMGFLFVAFSMVYRVLLDIRSELEQVTRDRRVKQMKEWNDL